MGITPIQAGADVATALLVLAAVLTYLLTLLTYLLTY